MMSPTRREHIPIMGSMACTSKFVLHLVVVWTCLQALLAAALQHKPGSLPTHRPAQDPTYITAAQGTLGSSGSHVDTLNRGGRHTQGTSEAYTSTGGSAATSGLQSSSAWFIPQPGPTRHENTIDHHHGTCGARPGRPATTHPKEDPGKLHVVRTCSPDGKVRTSRYHKKQELKAEIKRLLLSSDSHSNEFVGDRSLKAGSDLIYPEQQRHSLRNTQGEDDEDRDPVRRQRRRWSDGTMNSSQSVHRQGSIGREVDGRSRNVDVGRAGTGRLGSSSSVRCILRALVHKLAPGTSQVSVMCMSYRAYK